MTAEEQKEPAIQCDVIGWKVIFPDGKIWHQLTLEAAAATVMEWFHK